MTTEIKLSVQEIRNRYSFIQMDTRPEIIKNGNINCDPLTFKQIEMTRHLENLCIRRRNVCIKVFKRENIDIKSKDFMYCVKYQLVELNRDKNDDYKYKLTNTGEYLLGLRVYRKGNGLVYIWESNQYKK